MRHKSILLLFLFSMCTSPVEKTQVVSFVDASQLNSMIETGEVQVVDIRTDQEISVGMIETALNIDLYDPDFLEKIGELNKEMPVAVYCASGMRSAQAALEFEKMGFVQVYDLEGGFREWQIAGFNSVEPK